MRATRKIKGSQEHSPARISIGTFHLRTVAFSYRSYRSERTWNWGNYFIVVCTPASAIVRIKWSASAKAGKLARSEDEVLMEKCGPLAKVSRTHLRQDTKQRLQRKLLRRSRCLRCKSFFCDFNRIFDQFVRNHSNFAVFRISLQLAILIYLVLLFLQLFFTSFLKFICFIIIML